MIHDELIPLLEDQARAINSLIGHLQRGLNGKERNIKLDSMVEIKDKLNMKLNFYND